MDNSKLNKFAIIIINGKQYKVTSNDTILINKISLNIGEQIKITDILAIGTKDETIIGSPLLSNCVVVGSVQQHFKTSKTIILKKRRRKNSRRKKSYRQFYTAIKINSIEKG